MQVTFHFNVSDPVDYACRLVRKATHRRLTVLVCASPPMVARVSQALWMDGPQGFMPHAVQGEPPHVLARSPVYLCSDVSSSDHADVYINLQQDVAEHVGQFGRLIEIVPPDEHVRAQARQRWRHFAALGWTPEGFDAAAQSAQ